MPGMTLKVAKESKEHSRLLQELGSRVKMAEGQHTSRHAKWSKAEKTVACYVKPDADDAKRIAKRDSSDTQSYTTIMIPYSYAMLMSAHTYWSSVFLARDPVHQFSGRHGEAEMQVMAMESVIAYQTRIGGMIAPYYLWLYDAGKYGVGILGTYWDKEIISYSQLITGPDGQMGYLTNQVGGYEGNRVYNVSPYDFLPDPRVPVNRFQEGEFLAVHRTVSWNDLMRKKAQGYYTNTDLIKHTPMRKDYSADAFLERPKSIDIGADDSKHPAWVGLYEVYVTLIPKEWNLGNMEYPEKWVFTVTADLEIIIGAQPLGAIHDKYPFDVLECEPEAYGQWNRGIPEVVEPLQQTMDWLINSHFYNVRAIGNGRYIGDPSRVDFSQLENGSPGWIAALRPEAWGTGVKVSDVFQQIPMGDPTANHLNDVERIFGMGERFIGINEQMMGALGGGRKTATEIRTATGFGVNRLKTASEYMSATGFTTHSQKLVQNTQQFLAENIRVRLVGDQARVFGNQFISVSPQEIAGFYDFVPVDGTLPVDRFAQATLWKDIFGQMSRFPQIMAGYDWNRIFAWFGQLAGLKNMEQFRVQVAPDDMLQGQAQQGNLIQFPGGPPQGPGTQTNRAQIPVTSVGQ